MVNITNEVPMCVHATHGDNKSMNYRITNRMDRDERDFGLETETRVVSVSVSSFETEESKSQSQSHFLRPKGQSLSISLKI